MNPSRQLIALTATAAFPLFALTAVAENPGTRQRGPLALYQSEETDSPAAQPTASGQAGGAGTIREITADQFEQIDADRDERVSLSEFTNSPILSAGDGADIGQTPTVAAPRTDGTVVVKPAAGRNTPLHFRRLDKNRDRYLDSTEIAAFYLDEIEE